MAALGHPPFESLVCLLIMTTCVGPFGSSGIGIWFGLSTLDWTRAQLVRATFLVAACMAIMVRGQLAGAHCAAALQPALVQGTASMLNLQLCMLYCPALHSMLASVVNFAPAVLPHLLHGGSVCGHLRGPARLLALCDAFHCVLRPARPAGLAVQVRGWGCNH